MTQAKCCSLCKAHAGCKVAVLATDWQPGLNLCELKSGCTAPKGGMAHRVKCCLPGAPGNEGCSGKTPAPPAWQCKKDQLPTFCDATKPIDDRVAELVGKMTPVSQRHLPPYFLGHFSPVLRRLFAVLLRFPASWRQDGENGRKMA